MTNSLPLQRVCHVAVRERECERAVTVSTHRRTRRPAHQVLHACTTYIQLVAISSGTAAPVFLHIVYISAAIIMYLVSSILFYYSKNSRDLCIRGVG